MIIHPTLLIYQRILLFCGLNRSRRPSAEKNSRPQNLPQKWCLALFADVPDVESFSQRRQYL